MGSSMRPAPILAAGLVILVLHVVFVSVAQDFDADGDLPHYNCNDKNGNYTSKSTYQTNLHQLLSSLSSRPQLVKGFYNSSTGSNGPDRVNAIGLCRGDIDSTSCRACMDKSSREILERCPKRKEAIGWDENCTLRYSSRDIFGTMEENPRFRYYNTSIVSDPARFNPALECLFDSLRNKAAASAGNTLGKLATVSVRVNEDSQMTIYGLVQCTPDLPQQSCHTCLKHAFSTMANGSKTTYGWRTFFPSCRIRYELTQFYEQTRANQTALLMPPSPSQRNLSAPLSSPAQGNNVRAPQPTIGTYLCILVLLLSICLNDSFN